MYGRISLRENGRRLPLDELKRRALRDVVETRASQIAGATDTPEIDASAIVSNAHIARRKEEELEDEGKPKGEHAPA